ncbi:MAG: fibronectin type III domain-containing protein [Candidatus Nanopelagicales bacterium]
MLNVRIAALVGALSLTVALAPAATAQASPATPSPTTVSPAFGSVAGGYRFTITGTHLGGAGDVPSVTIGGAAATHVVVNDAGTSVSAVSPAGTTGDSDVVVTTTAGSGTEEGAYHYYSYVELDNGALRFGHGSDDSITPLGTLAQPFYWGGASAGWRQLTFGDYPLDLAVGYGTGGSNWTGGEVWSSQGPWVYDEVLGWTQAPSPLSAVPGGQVVDLSGYVGAERGTGIAGHGTVIVTTPVDAGGAAFDIRQEYTLLADGDYVKVVTTLTNTGETSATGATLWVGTRDDYVGGSDGPTKTKGNLVDGAFQQIQDRATPASALEVTTANEGVLFYSTTAGTNSSIDSCCDFSNAYNIAPTTSPVRATGDGSYTIDLPLGDMAPGQKSSLTWFYAAGAIADLAAVANEVASAAAPAVPEGEPGDREVTISWTAPQSDDPITDYQVRWSDDGGETWHVVAHETPSTATERTITGLTNGTSYLFEVAAVTGTGESAVVGEWSSPSEVVLPGAPTAPVLTAIEAGNAKATVSFTASVPSVEGSPVTNYEYRVGTGDWTALSPADTTTPVTVPGLTNGTQVSIRLRGITSYGASAPSNALTVTPAAPPRHAPTLEAPEATAGNASAALTWTEPESDEAITDYVVRWTDDDGETFTTVEKESPSTATSASVTGLVNGTWYVFQVAAVIGEGEDAIQGEWSSASDPVKPMAPPRVAPITAAPSATPGDRSVELSWAAPDSLEPITDYVVRWYDGTTWTTVEDDAPSTGTTTTVDGLVNGTSYVFQVAVVIGEGEDALQGGWSDPSDPVTPFVLTAPGAPTELSASPFDAAVDLEWVAPADDGGSAITGYVVELSTDGGDTWAVVGDPETGTTRSLVDLVNGTEYVFRVSAVNEIGTSEPSDPSEPVTPRAMFQPPANPTATYPSSVRVAVGATVRILPVVTLPEHATGFVVVSGSLPIGLRLDATTGAILGVPLAQGGPVTVRIGVRGPYGDVVGSDDVRITARGGYLVRFNAGSRSLSSQTYKVLRAAASAVRACPGCTLEIRGYAAYIHGSSNDARRIAALRALVVRDYLRHLGVGRTIKVTVGVGHAGSRGALEEQRKAVVTLRTPVR